MRLVSGEFRRGLNESLHAQVHLKIQRPKNTKRWISLENAYTKKSLKGLQSARHFLRDSEIEQI